MQTCIGSTIIDIKDIVILLVSIEYMQCVTGSTLMLYGLTGARS